MFSFISKIFKGVINFFTGLFGGGSSEGKFYKELDESQESTPQKPAPKSQPQPSQATKSESQAESKPKSEPKSQPKPEPKPVAANTSQNGKTETPAEPEKTFAPDYLMPTPSPSRRRPGPSYDMFKDMARQVKTPSA